jgi:molecular chaperone IbpA
LRKTPARKGFFRDFKGLETPFHIPTFELCRRSTEAAHFYRLTMRISKMRTFDFAPLYRSAIGFDRLAQLADAALRSDAQPSYPPYNIELVAEDKYRISMAVAGFERSELEIESIEDTLKIVGRKQGTDTDRTYLHRGIAARDFEHRFQLADHVRVVDASLDNGLLNIELVREVPEAKKPRKISIGGNVTELIERQAA